MEIALLVVGLVITVGSVAFMVLLYKSLKKEREADDKD